MTQPADQRIIAGSIVVNGAEYHWGLNPGPDVKALAPVMLHEIGHVLGLGHSMDTAAGMFFTDLPNAWLGEDDERGLCWLYPAGDPFDDAGPCDACESQANCRKGLACVPDGKSPSSYCLAPCSKDAHCPTSWSCVFEADGHGYCRPQGGHCTPGGGGVAMGGLCWDHGVCASGDCAVFSTTYALLTYCTQSCATDSDCPPGMQCGEWAGKCIMPGPVGDGGMCAGKTDCTSLACWAFPQGTQCAAPCDPAADTCTGGCVCNGSYQVPVCMPPANPAPEACNGVDDNCNGEVDEGCVECGAAWDLQGDSTEDIVDVQCSILTTLWFLQPYVEPPPDCLNLEPARVDVNCDGSVDVTDIQFFIHRVLGLSLPPAVDVDADGCPDACATVL